MNSVNINGSFSEPELVKRRRGGWLAITPRRLQLRIGAIGNSPEEARANFNELLIRWLAARDQELALKEPPH